MNEELKEEIREGEREVDTLLYVASGLQNFHCQGPVAIGQQPKLDHLGVMMTKNDSIVYEDVQIDNIGEMEKIISHAELNGFQRTSGRGFPIYLNYGEQGEVARILLSGRADEVHNQKFIVNTDKIWSIAQEKAHELDAMRKSAGIR